LGGTLAVFWAVFVLNSLLGGSLLRLGVIPRTTVGLRGILFAPFLHGSLNHIVANSFPFLALGWMVMLRDERHFIPVTVAGMVGSGLMAWLLGALETWMILRFLGTPVSLVTATVIEAFGTGIRFATFMIPGSLGALEGGYAATFAALGFGGTMGVSFSLVRRIREIVWIGVGLVAFAFLRIPHPPDPSR